MYEAQQFNIPALEGISQENIAQHIALYEGYVKNFNALGALIPELSKSEALTPALHEVLRRRSFEFGGMRLHEHYFPQFEGGAAPLNQDSELAHALTGEFGDSFEAHFTTVASLRGPGWALLYYDPATKKLLTGFTGEQHQGHFVTLPILLALDVWEHSYLLDYGAAGRGAYLKAFFRNLNWGVVEKRFALLQG